MKKLLLALFVLVSAKTIQAAAPFGTEIPISSYSETAQPTAFLFSSATIQIVGVTVSSPTSSGNGKIIVYFSTSSNYFSTIPTATIVNTSWLNNQNGNQYIPLFDMRNTSYTYIQKIGDAVTTIWLRCTGRSNEGLCPGFRLGQ